MVMLIEVHHLKAIELVGHCLNLLLLVLWNNFDAFSIPSDVLSWSRLSLAICLDGAIGSFAGMNVVWNWAGHVDDGVKSISEMESIWYVLGRSLLESRASDIHQNSFHIADRGSKELRQL